MNKANLTQYKLLFIAVVLGVFSACATVHSDDSDKYIPNQNELARERKEGYEIPPVLSAKNVLPKGVQQSKIYSIDDKVYNDGFLNHYTINTQWGKFYAAGDQKLESRLNEIIAIDALKKVSTTDAVWTGTKKAGKKIAMAPVNAVESLGSAIMHPQDTAETIVGIPVGIYDFFAGMGSKVDDEVVDTKEKYNDNSGGSSGVTKVAKKALDAGTDFAQDVIGYNENVTNLLKKYHIDPATDNQELQSEIRRIATIHTGVGLGASFVPSIPMVDFINDANKILGYVNKISIYEDKVVQDQKVREELLALGMDETSIRNFQKKTLLNSSQRTMITNYILSMPKVKNRVAIIKIAHKIGSKEAAEVFTQMVGRFVQLNNTYHFTEFLSDMPIPVAITASRQAFFAFPVDHLFWTKYLAEIMKKFNLAISKVPNLSKVSLKVYGKVSERSKQELAKYGIGVI